MHSAGILYVATGRRHFDMARISVASVRKVMPDVAIAVVTDLDETIDGCRMLRHPDPQHRFADKIVGIGLSPFDRTIFLDADTWVCRPLDDLFTLLDRFDLAAAFDAYPEDRPDGDCPGSFRELNTGVLVFRSTPLVGAFLAEWRDECARGLERSRAVGLHDECDQWSFRRVLYKSPLRLLVLSQEYNLTTWSPGFVPGGRGVAVLHGKEGKGLEEVARRVNATRWPRVVVPSIGYLASPAFAILSRTGERMLRLLRPLLGRLVPPHLRPGWKGQPGSPWLRHESTYLPRSEGRGKAEAGA